MSAAPLGVYVHWPFCKSKCPYCDFNSHVRDGVEQARWRAALLKELEYGAREAPGRRVETMFFGGGTPSLMEPDTVAALIARTKELWDTAPEIEITLEANPTSVEASRFAALAEAGVNRVSLGVQALDAATLDTIWTAIDRYAVVIFRDQRLTDAQLRDFSARFGPLEIGRAAARPGRRRLASPQIGDISNLDEDSNVRRLDDRRRLDSLGNREPATLARAKAKAQREAVSAQWDDRWYRRAWLGENLGWMGEKQMWLEPDLLILAAVLVLIATQASSMN